MLLCCINTLNSYHAFRVGAFLPLTAWSRGHTLRETQKHPLVKCIRKQRISISIPIPCFSFIKIFLSLFFSSRYMPVYISCISLIFSTSACDELSTLVLRDTTTLEAESTKSRITCSYGMFGLPHSFLLVCPMYKCSCLPDVPASIIKQVPLGVN